MMGFTSLTKEEIIASSVGNINTIGYLILRCLLCLLKKKTYERSAYIIGTCICISSHAFLVFAFCLADPCPSPITSRFLPFLCKMTKLPHVTCHSFPSIYYSLPIVSSKSQPHNATCILILMCSTLLTLTMYVPFGV